jgi:hypothetical protein
VHARDIGRPILRLRCTLGFTLRSSDRPFVVQCGVPMARTETYGDCGHSHGQKHKRRTRRLRKEVRTTVAMLFWIVLRSDQAAKPPSTASDAPLTKLAAGLTR